jgi:hypothetical protein
MMRSIRHEGFPYLDSELLRIQDFVDETVFYSFFGTQVSNSAGVLLDHGQVLTTALKIQVLKEKFVVKMNRTKTVPVSVTVKVEGLMPEYSPSQETHL